MSTATLHGSALHGSTLHGTALYGTALHRTAPYGQARDRDARQTAPRLRLTRRGRRVLVFLVAFPLVAAAMAFALNGGIAIATDTAGGQLQYVTVSAGESLWQVAETVAPSADPRDVVSEIVHLNQLSSADVQAGERLAIPARYSR
ncbi:LysM peptidoglycan-binding domain-containing protein [Parafrigoribacterium soli]|uniref:LysM peptidoglycan-binding domain-containing protein n=1 Tax=Parafrigoribacterium soli TaxID=3144663 RepID=UPI0032EB91BD